MRTPRGRRRNGLSKAWKLSMPSRLRSEKSRARLQEELKREKEAAAKQASEAAAS